MTALYEIGAVMRLELAEVRRSRWLVLALILYAVLAGGFVLVGLRESMVLGFTGLGRVLMSFTHALVLTLPLLGLAATAQVVNRAREDGALELFFSHCVSHRGYFVAVSLTRLIALVAPLLLALAAIALFGRFVLGQPVPWQMLLRAAAVGSALLVAFVGVGLAISTFVRSTARAMIYVLLVWALSVALVDFALIGAMLEWRLNPRVVFVLAGVNPVQAARMALLSAAEPDLTILGPVGFHLATVVGGRALFALGLLWPAVAGVLAWLTAYHSFSRRDLL